MLGLFARNKHSHTEILFIEKDISEFRKIRYILEVEGKICSLDPEFSTSGNLRKAVHRLNRDYNSKIYKEECNNSRAGLISHIMMTCQSDPSHLQLVR